MTTRDEHLKWCKDRALLELVDGGGLSAAVASMISDLGKWEGGPLYDADCLKLMWTDGMLFCSTAEQVRHWIEGFN